jgi:hypothetical protein
MTPVGAYRRRNDRAPTTVADRYRTGAPSSARRMRNESAWMSGNSANSAAAAGMAGHENPQSNASIADRRLHNAQPSPPTANAAAAGVNQRRNLITSSA